MLRIIAQHNLPIKAMRFVAMEMKIKDNNWEVVKRCGRRSRRREELVMKFLKSKEVFL
jgi:hypothetical protein